ncbi:PIN domain-like protein [Pestalotiopsis sp. NC0098]|nr:PIN domain-like protein [Pestalotiopsis sp. NC0098]
MGIEGLWDAVRGVAGGEEISLSHVNADWVSQKGRPMRIAIDTPMAIFQLKSTTTQAINYGGMNHPTRTLYYATLHILRTGVQPLFVFDGPNKPKKLGRSAPPPSAPAPGPQPWGSNGRTEEVIRQEFDVDHIVRLSKEMFDYLGISWRVAPGEAEAECAALEQAKIVDAVLTRDGDSFVFGSEFVLEKLVAEDRTAMVRCFRMEDLQKSNGRNREASSIITRKHLLQLALMSGGDYDKGIRGCGPTIALEAARIEGSCYKLFNCLQRDGNDREWRSRWRGDLIQGLRNKRHHAVANAVPLDFPNHKIASYYTTPAVTPSEQLHEWAKTINWDREIQMLKLRTFTEEYFNWRYARLCGKFVKILADTSLVKTLMMSIRDGVDGSALFEAITQEKTDPKMGDQLRVSFRPSRFINIDPKAEYEHPEFHGNLNGVFDPHAQTREWLPKWLLQKAAPKKFLEWEQKQSKGATAKKRKSADQLDAAPKRPRGRPPKQRASNPSVDEAPSRRTTDDRGPYATSTSNAVLARRHEIPNAEPRQFQRPVHVHRSQRPEIVDLTSE